MKIHLNIEAESTTELQNAVLQLADFCSLSAGDAPSPCTAAEAGRIYTTEQVRALIEPLVEAKGPDWIKGLMSEFGSSNLSKMDPAQYPDLLRKAGIAA